MSDGSTPAITWTSSESGVATVENGVVTAVSAGTATITATAGELSATCEITVTDKYELMFSEIASETELYVGDNVTLDVIAKKNGVNIIVITCYDRSPLAKYADHILFSTKREAAYEGGSLSTLASISYIINVLYSAIYEKLGKDGYEINLRTAQSVADKSM